MDLDKRLIRRYTKLVKSHMIMSTILSSGVKSTLEGSEAFNQTQGAWRFFNNESCTLSELIKPIHKMALEQSEQLNRQYNLVVHDWSGLIYKKHTSKQDRYGVHHEKELGYELQASLLLNDENGGPIAPIALNVATKETVLSTYSTTRARGESHLDELAQRIDFIESNGFKKPIVHIVDREGDSVELMRALKGRKWLLRCRSNSCVRYEGKSIRVDKLGAQLCFKEARSVNYKGQQANQHLSEVEVQVTRDAQHKKKTGKPRKIKGEPVLCRLVVSKVIDSEGKILAWWYLLSNLPEDVGMGDIALWYYWRWSIETFFKLLKSAGMQLESWQQETGEAIARRLLVACMACVYVWQLAEAKGPEAGELRKLLVRLSARQMKYGVKFTRPALFAGLCSLLNTLDLLENYNINELKQMLLDVMGEAFV